METSRRYRTQLVSSLLGLLLVLLCAQPLTASKLANEHQFNAQAAEATALTLTAATHQASSFKHPKQQGGNELTGAEAVWPQPPAIKEELEVTPLPQPWFHRRTSPPDRTAGWRESNLTYRASLTYEV
ncbi:hypothetical protein [Ferrimonas sp. YFM]|uniref:hypothetical protein n=1 Tax=Ferrimonas sp. YFM TaxID=3028878 RepID=UPI0025742814|nr:hypothetical protein [Ferrimonas sp. YFM]BDY07096.1 hypothetical protein F0521_41370 [Ferrimonas sp. YFM]